MSAIAKLYADKVLSGEKTLDDVPERWREEVKEILDTKTTPTLLMQSNPTEESTPADESESTDENR